MFKRAHPHSAATPSPTQSNRTLHSAPDYAFTASTAHQSSEQARIQHLNTFHQPLPNPSSSSSGQGQKPQTPDLGQHRSQQQQQQRFQTNNPFADPSNPPRQYQSRSPSPSASRPLLNGASPIAYSPGTSITTNMPGRNYPTRGAGGMPARGESQNGLLADQGRSAARRYGPTASSQPISPSAALLQSHSNSSGSSPSDRTHPSSGANSEPWAAGLDGVGAENDDYLHNPDPKRDRKNDHGGSIFTSRGLTNIGCLVLLLVCLITLFAGYPIISHYVDTPLKTNGAYNLGGINSTGQVPNIANFPTLVDPDTPQDKRTRTGFDGQQYDLVFSDEFNKDGRTFYPGDDPFFTAVDIHYWPTVDFEWYDPSAITTQDGNLVITMTQEPIHELNFKSGMLQSWNQLCFQNSFYVEVSVSLPGNGHVSGFWPGVWLMGNLGRPGYGATTEGMWPYTYDSCDLGTLPNQTNAAGTGPAAALGINRNDGTALSYLPGQRVSACTCAGEDHPGPSVSHGRGVPEVDILEAQVDLSVPRGQVSQSFQVAPFDADYLPKITGGAIEQDNLALTSFNSYKGGPYQQAVSSVTYINDAYYTGGVNGGTGAFNTYGIELFSDPNNRDNGFIHWVSSGVKSWSVYPAAVGANATTQISQRLIPEEPMALVMNFGMSSGFAVVEWNDLAWPATMLIDYIRVYQRPEGKLGCDTDDRPTAKYINNHMNAYTNPNYTVWADAGYTFPKNSLKDSC